MRKMLKQKKAIMAQKRIVPHETCSLIHILRSLLRTPCVFEVQGVAARRAETLWSSAGYIPCTRSARKAQAKRRADRVLFFYEACPVRAPGCILSVVGAEDTVEIGGVLLEGNGTVEELLGRHGEELSFVCRAVCVEECFVPLLGEAS